MEITIDTLTNLATLSSPVTMKAGSQIPVSIAMQTGGAPATLSGTPVIELALSTQSVPAEVLAYLDTFTASAGSLFNGELDGTDTRLVTYMGSLAAATLNLEVAWTIGAERFIAPNLTVVAQAPIMSGPQTSSGGPTYATTAQLTAALAGLSGSAAVVSLPQAGTVTIAPGAPFLIYQAPLSASAGTGAYTQTIVLSDANAQAGALMQVPIDIPGAPNPTINIYNGSASGTLLQTLGTGGAPSQSFLFTARFDGTNWHKLDAHWVI